MDNNMEKQNSIIAFGAHPDDIEIGLGGTLKRLSQNSREIIMVIATIPNQKEIRRKESENAARMLGVSRLIHVNIPLDDFGFNRKTIGEIDDLLNRHQPSTVFTHWRGDSHQDHVNLTSCVLAGARHNHFNVYMYEQTIPGGITDASFRPQLFIDITPHLEDKIKSIKLHASQCAKYGDGWLEGLRGRAAHRGYQIKTKFAEAFEVVKIKEDTALFTP